jgi:hypothetical protein
MDPLSSVDRLLLVNALAFKERTITQLCTEYAASRDEIIAFGNANREQIEKLRKQEQAVALEKASDEPTPTQLSELWITNKFERIKRLQDVADKLYVSINDLGADAVTVREFRSYLLLVANELGQLLHRGAGDSAEADTLRVDISGIDMETLR